MNRLFAITLLILLTGCGDNIQARKYNLRNIEPGTIAYRYESMAITIDETKIALEGFQKNKEAITNCFGEDRYKEMESEVQEKIKFVNSDRPYYLTKLFLGNVQARSSPKQYNSRTLILISQAIGKCLAQQSEAMRIPAGTGKAGSTDNASTPSGYATSAVESQVSVPDLTSNCQQDPEKALEAIGLKSNYKSIHGPIDSDATSLGCAYRQIPAPGTLVNKGSTVSYRTWWEGS